MPFIRPWRPVVKEKEHECPNGGSKRIGSAKATCLMSYNNHFARSLDKRSVGEQQRQMFNSRFFGKDSRIIIAFVNFNA